MHIVKEKFPEQRGTDAGWKTFPTGKADRFLSRQAAQEAQFWFSFMRRHRHGADSIRKLIVRRSKLFSGTLRSSTPPSACSLRRRFDSESV
jgi:hypothetical protein